MHKAGIDYDSTCRVTLFQKVFLFITEKANRGHSRPLMSRSVTTTAKLLTKKAMKKKGTITQIGINKPSVNSIKTEICLDEDSCLPRLSVSHPCLDTTRTQARMCLPPLLKAVPCFSIFYDIPSPSNSATRQKLALVPGSQRSPAVRTPSLPFSPSNPALRLPGSLILA